LRCVQTTDLRRATAQAHFSPSQHFGLFHFDVALVDFLLWSAKSASALSDLVVSRSHYASRCINYLRSYPQQRCVSLAQNLFVDTEILCVAAL